MTIRYLFLLLITTSLLAFNKRFHEDKTPLVVQSFSDVWKFRAGEGRDSLWMSPDYNDSAWVEVSSFKILTDQQIQLHDGFGWYRKTIRLSDSLKNELVTKGALVLRLGRLAAADEVYFNGELIGKTGEFPPDYKGYFDGERNYLVPGDMVLTDSDNLIAVKFNQGWGTGGFLAGSKLAVSSAETNDKIRMDVTVDDTDHVFLDTDSFQIHVGIKNTNRWSVKGDLMVKLMTDTYQSVKYDSITVSLDALDGCNHTFDLKNPAPGIYRYQLEFRRNGEIACGKSFNVGYEPEKIASPIDAKSDFKAFWDNALKELASVAPQYKLTLKEELSKQDYEIFLVEMNSLDNERIRGYYARPKRKGKFPVIVEYMGYGSSAYPPTQQWDGFAHFVLSIRGQALNLPENKYGEWGTFGLQSKDTYYYRGAYMDVVRALDFVCSRPELDSERIGVRGGSQGGALSFVAAALDKRVKAAAPNIPFLSDFPDYFKICPWPKSEFDDYLKKNPGTTWDDIYELLSYFDIKNLAQWIECPLLMGVGLQDNVCPPHINFAAYNQVMSEKSWMVFPDFTHSVGKEYYEASKRFFDEKLGVK